MRKCDYCKKGITGTWISHLKEPTKFYHPDCLKLHNEGEESLNSSSKPQSKSQEDSGDGDK